MAYNLRNRNFLKILDFSPKELNYLLDLARDLKRAKYTGTEQPTLKGKNIALIFEKTSTRTRSRLVQKTRVLTSPIWAPPAARSA